MNVQVDPSNVSRLIFDVPVTLEEAIRYLYPDFGGSIPQHLRNLNPPAVRVDPAEPARNGKSQRFLLNLSEFDVATSLSQELRDFYGQRFGQRILGDPTPAERPGWVPESVWQRAARLGDGLAFFVGIAPWGLIYVWRNRGRIEFFMEYPEDLGFYRHVTDGDDQVARLLRDVFAQINQDMYYFTVVRQYSISQAREEIRRINDRVLLALIEGIYGLQGMGAIAAMSTGLLRFLRQELPRVRAALVRWLASRRRAAANVRPPPRHNPPPTYDINDMLANHNVGIIKRMVRERWSRPEHWPVKVIPIGAHPPPGHPPLSVGSRIPVRGFITSRNMARGTYSETLRRLGIAEHMAPGGFAVAKLRRLPADNEFDLRLYSNISGGGNPRLPPTPASLVNYPIGEGAPQWELTAPVDAEVVLIVPPGGRVDPF